MNFNLTPTPVSQLIDDKKLVINDGYRAKNSELSSHGLSFARAGNINDGFHFDGADCFPEDKLEKVGIKISEPGDVVFTSKGTVGRFAFVRPTTQRFVYSPQLCFWRSLDQDVINSRFLFYWMNSPEFYDQYKRVSGQTDMADYVSLRNQRAMEITLPELTVQSSIAEILGDFDDKIDLLREMNATLEDIARSLFRAWFVDFEPVRAKAAGATSFHGMPQELFDALSDSFEDSEIGEIPAGWEVEPIGKLANCVGGGTPSTKNEAYWSGGQHPFCTPKDMSDLKSMALFDTSRHVTDAGLSKISSGALPVGTVLMSSRAPIGYIAVNWCEVSINQGIVALIPTKLPTEYLRYWLQFSMPTIKANAGGSTFAEISKSKFRQIDALRPPEDFTANYSAIAKPLFEKVACNVKTITVLEQLRDTLLPKLISGEIEAPDLEALADGG